MRRKKEILDRIGKARGTRDKASLSKLLSKISDDAQKDSNVGISVKVLAETVRYVVEADDLRTGGASSARLSQEDTEAIMDGAVEGFGVGATAGAMVGGGLGAIGGGIVGFGLGGPSGASAGGGIGAAAAGGAVGLAWGVYGAAIGAGLTWASRR
jgi:hypothetical protein